MEPPKISKQGQKRIETDAHFRVYHTLHQSLDHLTFGIEEVRECVPSELIAETRYAKDAFYQTFDWIKQSGDFQRTNIPRAVIKKLDDIRNLDWSVQKTLDEVYACLETFKPADYDNLVH
ncbi:hypothetical protein HY484_00905 [Candidatus Woesearchaeota archaeon]|nr:hypothetical protein [Candidatus Woesearchaeota archaeon]